MIDHQSLHVVIGATGGIGGAIARELANEGRPVRGIARAISPELPESVEQVVADATSVSALAPALAGASVVYHCAQPDYTRWPQEFPPMTEAILTATGAAGARLIFADNLYMYGPGSSPMTEDTPNRATDPKGKTRRRMADRLLAAHVNGEVEVAIGRASDYFGPWGTGSAIGERLFSAVLNGKKAYWLGNLDQPHSVSFLEDIARGLIILGDRSESLGQVWHLACGEPTTGRQFLETALMAAEKAPKMTADSPAMLRIAGLFSPQIREVSSVMYQWTAPFISDSTKFDRAFGPFQSTSNHSAIQQTVAWFQSRNGDPPIRADS